MRTKIGSRWSSIQSLNSLTFTSTSRFQWYKADGLSLFEDICVSCSGVMGRLPAWAFCVCGTSIIRSIGRAAGYAPLWRWIDLVCVCVCVCVWEWMLSLPSPVLRNPNYPDTSVWCDLTHVGTICSPWVETPQVDVPKRFDEDSALIPLCIPPPPPFLSLSLSQWV